MGQAVEVEAVGHIVDQDVSVYRTDTDITAINRHQFNSFVLRRHTTYIGEFRFLENFSAAVCES